MEDKNTKEINLLQLLAIVIDWLKNIIQKGLKFAGLSLQLAVKHWVITVSVLILSVALGQYLARPAAKKYNANAVALLYGVNVSTAKEVCRQLENSLGTEKTQSLAFKLGIADSVAKNIVCIQNFSVIDYLKDGSQDAVDLKRGHSLNDTLNLIMQDRFYLQVTTRNIAQLPVVQQALLNYFNTNPMMKGEYESVKKGLEEKAVLCDKEIARLDSLAKVSYFKDADPKISLVNNKLVVGEQMKQLFYNDVLNLQSQKSLTQNVLINFKQPMNFPSGLVLNPMPINGRAKYGVYSILIGSAIALVLAFLLENLKKITNYLTNKK